MKAFLHALLWVCLPTIFFAQTRDCDPVVLKGTTLPCMLGESPTEVVAFRYQNGAWQQIPVQIDEMVELDVATPYGEASGDCFYKSREDVEWDMLFYADANTYTGPDVSDPNFDGDDELAFMAKDVGEIAPLNACPAGVISSTKCQVNVQDPLDGNTILGQVYLFVRSGNLAQDAGKDYVNYDYDFGADYKDIYQVCIFEGEGSNPESSTVTTDNYSIHFSRRWVKDEVKITAGNATGVDIIDQHQYFINVNACNRNEETFSNGKGPIIANIDGPVRGIRSVMGANSGTFMRLDIVFTECRSENRMFYRLHPANGYYDAFDLNTEAIGMSYYNDQNPGGIIVDGDRDQLDKTNPNKWELLSGVQGSIAAAYTFETDIQLGTEEEYDQGLVEGFVAAYQSDLGPGTPRKCTGDGASYNASGFCLRTLECTDNRYEFENAPECLPENVKYFDQVRYHYFLAPQTTKEQAEQYASFATNPLTATVNAQNCNGNSQPTCTDGVQNGDEAGIDCGGTDCPPCQAEPTCDDGVQNGDETGIDCGGTDCPPCQVVPTCDDGVQNGDETGIDCGGTDCPPCQVAPTCDAPNTLFVSNNDSGTSAQLNWNVVDEAEDYTVNVRQQGTSSWRSATTSSSSLVASPLQNGKIYEWRVKSNCSDDSSEWSAIQSFEAGSNTTEPTCDDGMQNGDETGVDCGGTDCPPCQVEPTCDDGVQNGDETGVDCGGADCPACSNVDCETPAGLATNNVVGRKATLDWEGVSGAIDYTIQIRQVGAPNWVERTTTSTFFRVQPLVKGATYEWRVRANCAGESSPFSNLVFFEAGSNSQNSISARSSVLDVPLIAKVYPSPTNDILNVQVNQAIEHIEVIDMMGRSYYVNASSLSDNVIQLELAALQAGNYWLRIKVKQEVKVLRFVKA